MDGSVASGIDNEKATTDVDDSRWEAFDISSSEDEYEMDIDDEDSIREKDDEPTSENTSDVVVIKQVTGSSQLDHTKQEDNKDPYDIDAEMSRQRKYEAVRAMIFVSEEAAYYFYNKYAKEHGFSIRREKKKERLDELGTPTIRVSYNRKKGVWTVLRFDENHNHKPATADQIAFMRSHRKIKAHQKSRIMSFGSLFGMRLFNIMRTFISDNGKYSRVGFVRKDLYNMSCREKRKMLAKGDANTTIGIMEKRKRDDPEFYFDYKLGKGGKLLHLFWCDSQSRQDYADFGDVLVFDSTYKTNRYAMPFIPFVGINNHRQTTVFACAIVSDEKEVTYKWLLETFLKAMYQQKPKGIITDGDAAMIAAVGKFFPGVWYRVCTWHIEKNMKKHIDSLAHNEFRSLLYYTTSEQVFEERWRAFVEKHQTELTKEWMKRMYRRKKLWSAAYLANGYFLGMKSNQRSESLNSTLHTHLDFGLTMVDMVVHYENNSSRVREEEARQDTIDSQTVPVAVTRYKDIEMSAARKFTATNFYLVQGELKKIGGLEII
ncbi:protein FAR1-RELATED SEQUENCE 5-like [Lolium perenne]|uniref:protein FAR1-RELATED SEQUENCE 5-like n=1 Tax=Lolium perenne TaxID=4522 RepID=UPI003A99D5DA